MSTKFLVGENLVLEDLLARPADEVKKELNTNLDVVDLSEFKSMENMEKYSYETFLRKSKLYLNSNPPDYVQSAEKCWMSSVYAIKELYLSAGGVLLKSHDAMSYGVIFAIESQPNLECQRILFLKGAWGVAQDLHRFCYGGGQSRPSKFEDYIKVVEEFVMIITKFDKKLLSRRFEEMEIKGNKPNVKLINKDGNIIMGGYPFSYKCAIAEVLNDYYMY